MNPDRISSKLSQFRGYNSLTLDASKKVNPDRGQRVVSTIPRSKRKLLTFHMQDMHCRSSLGKMCRKYYSKKLQLVLCNKLPLPRYLQHRSKDLRCLVVTSYKHAYIHTSSIRSLHYQLLFSAKKVDSHTSRRTFSALKRLRELKCEFPFNISLPKQLRTLINLRSLDLSLEMNKDVSALRYLITLRHLKRVSLTLRTKPVSGSLVEFEGDPDQNRAAILAVTSEMLLKKDGLEFFGLDVRGSSECSYQEFQNKLFDLIRDTKVPCWCIYTFFPAASLFSKVKNEAKQMLDDGTISSSIDFLRLEPINPSTGPKTVYPYQRTLSLSYLKMAKPDDLQRVLDACISLKGLHLDGGLIKPPPVLPMQLPMFKDLHTLILKDHDNFIKDPNQRASYIIKLLRSATRLERLDLEMIHYVDGIMAIEDTCNGEEVKETLTSLLTNMKQLKTLGLEVATFKKEKFAKLIMSVLTSNRNLECLFLDIHIKAKFEGKQRCITKAQADSIEF